MLFLRRARGVLGLAAVWAAAGALLGSLVGAAHWASGFAFFALAGPRWVQVWAALGAGLGGAVGAGLGLTLLLVGPRAVVPTRRAAALGAWAVAPALAVGLAVGAPAAGVAVLCALGWLGAAATIALSRRAPPPAAVRAPEAGTGRRAPGGPS